MALSTAHCTALLLAAPAGGAWNIILDSRAAFKERVHVQCTRASDSQMRVADRHGARVPGCQGVRVEASAEHSSMGIPRMHLPHAVDRVHHLHTTAAVDQSAPSCASAYTQIIIQFSGSGDSH